VEDEQLGTTLRVAGGWVRDKVLGQWAPDGHVDIDIALDNMMGSEVGQLFLMWKGKCCVGFVCCLVGYTDGEVGRQAGAFSHTPPPHRTHRTPQSTPP